MEGLIHTKAEDYGLVSLDCIEEGLGELFYTILHIVDINVDVRDCNARILADQTMGREIVIN